MTIDMRPITVLVGLAVDGLGAAHPYGAGMNYDRDRRHTKQSRLSNNPWIASASSMDSALIPVCIRIVGWGLILFSMVVFVADILLPNA